MTVNKPRLTAAFQMAVALLSTAMAAVLAAASPGLRTAVKQGLIAVADMLTGGLPDALALPLERYAVAGVLFCLTALAAWVLWLRFAKKPLTASAVGIGAAFIPALCGAIGSAWLSAVAAVAGGVFGIAAMWAYTWLQKKLPSVFNRETVSYIVFGVLTTVVSFVSQMMFSSMGLPVLVNTVGSWICAVIFAYAVNKLFVFESRTDTAKAFFRELWLFFAARLASLGLELVFMLITVEWLSFNEAVCKLIAQVFILIANYVFSKLVIFKKNDTHQE